VAAAEEERFRRIKHRLDFRGDPLRLNEAGVELRDVAHVAVNQDAARTSTAISDWLAAFRAGPAKASFSVTAQQPRQPSSKRSRTALRR
jgi:predicted NodU family carbamoyl transferase